MKKLIILGTILGAIATNHVSAYVVRGGSTPPVGSLNITLTRILSSIESNLKNEKYSKAGSELEAFKNNQLFSTLFLDKKLRQRYYTLMGKVSHTDKHNYAYRYFTHYFKPKVWSVYRAMYGVSKVKTSGLKTITKNTSRSNLGTGAQEDSYQEWCEKHGVTCLY